MMEVYDGYSIGELGEILRRGGAVIYPTETSYALGCLATSGHAVQRVMQLKQRPADRSLPVIVANLDMLRRLGAKVEPLHETLAEHFWPGPLTIVFSLSPDSPLADAVQGDQREVAARVSAHPIARRLVDAVGGPLVSTSANVSGRPSTGFAGPSLDYFRERGVPVMDGGRLAGNASTIVRVEADGKTVAVLRPGALPTKDLARVAPIRP